MKTLSALLAVLALATAVPAAAQTTTIEIDESGDPETVIVDLNEAAKPDHVYNTVVAAGVGVLFGNIATGGVLLAPLVGPTASSLMGGAWLFGLGITQAASSLAIHAGSTAALALTAGYIGYEASSIN